MGIKLKAGGSDRAIPPGQYKAVIADISVNSFINKRKTLVFRFEIAEGPYKGSVHRAFVNAQYESFSAFSKFFKWYSVVAGEEPERGDDMDLDDFKDKVLLVKIDTKESKKTRNPFSNVTDVLEVISEL